MTMEQTVWLTAFSTAFTEQLERRADLTSFNNALATMTYERAEAIADAAVAAFRECVVRRTIP